MPMQYVLDGPPRKWWWPAPWVFVALGTILIAASTTYSGVVLRSVDERLASAEGQEARLEEQINAAFDFKDGSGRLRNTAMLLLQRVDTMTGAASDALDAYMLNTAQQMLIQAIEQIENAAGRYAADAPFNDIYKELNGLRSRVSAGDRNAIARSLEVSDISTSIITRNINDLVTQRRELRIELRTLNSRKEFARTIALGLQILGVLLVMFKDVPDPGTLLRIRRKVPRPEEAAPEAEPRGTAD